MISSLIVAIVILFINTVAFSSTYKEPYKEILVREGDTLWKIAMEYMPDNYDIRKMVYDIREFNDMENADIYPGEIIRVPIIYDYQ